MIEDPWKRTPLKHHYILQHLLIRTKQESQDHSNLHGNGFNTGINGHNTLLLRWLEMVSLLTFSYLCRGRKVGIRMFTFLHAPNSRQADLLVRHHPAQHKPPTKKELYVLGMLKRKEGTPGLSHKVGMEKACCRVDLVFHI